MPQHGCAPRREVGDRSNHDCRDAETAPIPGHLVRRSCLLIFLRDDGIVVFSLEDDTMIEGLKLTMTGKELRDRLERRIHEHVQRAERWKRELTRTAAEQTMEEPLLPDQMCENEAEREEWHVEVLTFILDHVEEEETYRLGQTDLAFGELLPDKPDWMEQEEFENEASTRFGFEQLTKEVRNLHFRGRDFEPDPA